MAIKDEIERGNVGIFEEGTEAWGAGVFGHRSTGAGGSVLSRHRKEEKREMDVQKWIHWSWYNWWGG